MPRHPNNAKQRVRYRTRHSIQDCDKNRAVQPWRIVQPFSSKPAVLFQPTPLNNRVSQNCVPDIVTPDELSGSPSISVHSLHSRAQTVSTGMTVDQAVCQQSFDRLHAWPLPSLTLFGIIHSYISLSILLRPLLCRFNIFSLLPSRLDRHC